MPFGSVQLLPGVNVEATPTALQASIATSSNIRFRDGLTQKIGGWQKFYAFNVAGVPRDLHAWEDTNGATHLLSGTTSQLGMITGGVSFLAITPQIYSTNSTVSLSTSTGSLTVTVTDSNVANPTILDTVNFKTPVSVGGIIVSGVYPIQTIAGTSIFTITSATAALTLATNTGTVPYFTTTANSNLVQVTLTAHGIGTGGNIAFEVPTTVASAVISGVFPITYTDANNFTISVPQAANANATGFMNGGLMAIDYYIAIGPSPSGAGYGTGGYGSGGYGSGVTPTAQTGTPISATDWTSDNWGRLAVACPANGAGYIYDPQGGYNTATVIPTAPIFNDGCFVSTNYQMLFFWGSTGNATVGQYQDPMLIRWSDIGDYTQFTASTTNQAGSYRIPIGSVIRGGMAVQTQNLFWTDLDLWAATYCNYPLVWGFNKIGSGAGLVGRHGAQQFRGGVYWMGPSNFYSYIGGTVKVMDCPLWDFVFQNINTTYLQNVRAMPNTPFNEVGWLFPSANSTTGENDSYIKVNVVEKNMPWDAGQWQRSAWIDQTVLGNPIAATPGGTIYQHEMGNDADGQPITSTFTTGYFYIGEGQEFAFVDKIIPDMIWGTYAGQKTAQVYVTIQAINFPGDAPTSYGPYLMTQAIQEIDVRIRARQMAFTFTSTDNGSFWRIGKVRYRWAPSGRR